MQYLPENFTLSISTKPLKSQDIYHYHRPNLETTLLHNSVVTVHHDLSDTDAWFDSDDYVGKYKGAGLIVCLNTDQQNILKNSYGITNTIVIPHGINENIFTKKNIFNPPNKKFNIGIVSKFYGRRVKGESFLFEIAKRLNPKNIMFTLVGQDRAVTSKMLEGFGFEVDLHEDIPYRLFNEIYHSIDVLLMPSLFEGGPANIPEALYTGTPILAKMVGMVHDFLLPGVNGLELTGDVGIDSKVINNLSINKADEFVALKRSMGDSGQVIPTWEDVVGRYQKAYEGLS